MYIIYINESTERCRKADIKKRHEKEFVNIRKNCDEIFSELHF